MAQAELVDDRIVVATEFHEKERIKQIPGSRWDPNSKMWSVPLSWGACKALRGIFRDGLSIGPDLASWAWQQKAERVDPALALRQAVTVDAVYDERLYPFQNAGVAFLQTAKQALLADEMGTGKTVQTIIALRELQRRNGNAYPACLIVPNSMKTTWAKEYATWDPDVTVVMIAGSAAKRGKQFAEARDLIAEGEQVAVVINWEGVRGHSKLAPYGSVHLTAKEKEPKELNEIEWGAVVADEAHKQKEPKSKQTRAVWAVQHGPSVNYRFSLTGTPLANHPGDFWALLHGIAPDDFPAKSKYIDRYCLQNWNPFGGLDIIGVRPDTREEFYSIVDPRFRRMPKDLVLPFLPKKMRMVRYAGMHPKQKKAYDDIESSMGTRLDDGGVVLSTNSLTQATRLLQFSSAYATVNEEGEVRLEDVKGTATSGPTKLDVMMEILDEMNGESIVFAAESRQLIELAALRLEKAKVSFRKIVGGLTPEERQQHIYDFQNGHAQVMLMTLKAGGVGLTLTRAGVMVFLQRSWSMIDNKQGEDRVHRIGSEQHDKVVVIDIITKDTVEEEQIPRLHEKFLLLQEITRDRDVMMANGDMEAVARLDAEMARIDETPLWVDNTEAA